MYCSVIEKLLVVKIVELEPAAVFVVTAITTNVVSLNLVICNCFHLSITQCVYDVSRPRQILLSLQSQDQNLKGQEDQEYYLPLQGD
jgi:MFS superfamily sulfate permease-like transporter